MSLLTGLVAYWPFDEGAGTVAYDVTGNGHDAVVGSGCTWAGPLPGTHLHGINFPGTGASGGAAGVTIPAPTPLLDFSGDMTLSLWFKTTSIAVGLALMGFYGAGVAHPGYGILFNYPSTGNVSYWNGNGNAGGVWSSFGVSGQNDGNLHHLALSVFQSNNGWIAYYDGVQFASNIIALPQSYTGSRCIGMVTTEATTGGLNSNLFDGVIGGVGLWRRAFSIGDAQRIYSDGKGSRHPFGIRRMGRPLGSRIIMP